MAYRGDIRPYVRMEFTMKVEKETLDKNEYIWLPGLQKDKEVMNDWTYACWDVKDVLGNS